MIPYFTLTEIQIGPLAIHAWGLFVVIGFFVGGAAASWMAKKRGQNPKVIWDLLTSFMLLGMVGGRIGHVLFYEPAYYAAHPLEIFQIWHGGLSVFGGLFACIAYGIWYMRRKQLDVWQYADIMAFGLPFGKVFGRIGCFVIHDHPGTLTDFVLGVKQSNGEVRHDLGLYLALNAFAMSLVLLALSRKERPTGFYVAFFCIWYGTARFFLDFFRVVDVRLWMFTPGQYFCFILILFGISTALWITKRSKK